MLYHFKYALLEKSIACKKSLTLVKNSRNIKNIESSGAPRALSQLEGKSFQKGTTSRPFELN